MRPGLAAIMAIAATAAMGEARTSGVWQDRPRPKQRPHVQRMVGGTDAEINAWNAAVEQRKAAKKGAKL